MLDPEAGKSVFLHPVSGHRDLGESSHGHGRIQRETFGKTDTQVTMTENNFLVKTFVKVHVQSKGEMRKN
jgi:hypothetical protein